MKKQKMITRTMFTTTVTYMAVDVSTATVATYTDIIVGKHSADSALLELKDAHETETFKVVSVVSLTVDESLYGMTEREFLAHAVKLPPRSTADNE